MILDQSLKHWTHSDYKREIGVYMKINLKCLQCNIGQITKVADIVDATENQKEQVSRAVFEYLKDIDFSKSNPEIMKGTWRIITDGFDNEDPYRDIYQGRPGQHSHLS